MNMDIFLRLAGGVGLAMLGLAVVAFTSLELRLDRHEIGALMFLAGVFLAYRAVKAHYDSRDGA